MPHTHKQENEGTDTSTAATTTTTEVPKTAEISVKQEPLDDDDLAMPFSDLWAADKNDSDELDRYEQTLRVCIAFYTNKPLFRYIAYVVARECIMVRISNFCLAFSLPPLHATFPS